ncbi:MAG: hypothetical protein ACREX6_06370, partial [Casimicrobiaceae bacterium]
IEPLRVTVTGENPGWKRSASLDVPREAPFFGDHFPRRAVFPATLLLDTMLRLALDGAVGAPALSGAAPRALKVTHVKMRSFIEPGQHLDLDVELADIADASHGNQPAARADHGGWPAVDAGNAVLRAMLFARTAGRMVATARVEIGGVR